MIVSRPRAEVSATSRYLSWSGAASPSLSRPSMPSRPFIGVRISWLMVARNADLASLAWSARTRAARSSALLRSSESVRSRTRASSSSLSVRRRVSASRRVAISSASRALRFSSVETLGSATNFGISGQIAIAVVSDTAAVITLRIACMP